MARTVLDHRQCAGAISSKCNCKKQKCASLTAESLNGAHEVELKAGAGTLEVRLAATLAPLPLPRAFSIPFPYYYILQTAIDRANAAPSG